MKKYLIMAMIFIACLSCVKSAKEMVFSNDFEQTTAWCDVPLVKFGQGHSGFYYSPTDSIQQYSVTFSRKIRELGPEPMKAAELSLWVRPGADGAFVNYVLSIERDNKSLHYFSMDSKNDAYEPNQWAFIESRYEIPADVKLDDVVKIYAWNVSGKNVDVDDFEFRFKY